MWLAGWLALHLFVARVLSLLVGPGAARQLPALWCRSEAVCQPLPDFVTAERPAAYRPVPWREFMQARVAGVWGGRSAWGGNGMAIGRLELLAFEL